MRTLSATLLAEQRDSSVAPYIRVHLTSPDGQTTHTFQTTDSPNRLYRIESTEGLFGSTAQTRIQIKNDDQAFSALDLRGYKVEIGWGCVTGAGNEYSEQAPLWVLEQRDQSEEGILLTELFCVDIWWRLAQLTIIGAGYELRGTISGTFQVGEDVTNGGEGGGDGIADRVLLVGSDWIIVTGASGTTDPLFQTGDVITGSTSSATITLSQDGTAGGGIGSAPSFGDATILNILRSLTADIADIDDDTGGSDDRISDTSDYQPDSGDPILGLIRRFIEMTNSALRFENDEDLHLIYLDPAPGSNDYEYDTDHAFQVEARAQRLVLPNKVFVISEIGNMSATYGVANDATSQTAIGVVPIIVEDPDVAGDQTLANNRAAAMLLRLQQETVTGRVVAPMNCGQELLDYIEITDTRANVTVNGRIGRIVRRYGSGTYQIECILGGILDYLDVSDPDSFLDSLQIYTYGRIIIPGGVIAGPITSPSVTLDASQIPYTPAVLTDWDSDADPGDADDALDQLAERVDDNEIAIAANVPKSLFDANTILKADTDDTPVALTVTEQTLVGRLTGGSIAAVAIGIADNNILQVDGSPNSGEYARFTAAGVEGRTEAEFKADFNLEIGVDVLAQQTIGIADDNLVEIDDADAVDDDYAKFTATGLEGRSYSEVLGDLSGQAGADFSMNTHKITSVVDPVDNQDAATKKYVDDTAGGASLYAFKTITGITNDVVADAIGDTLTLASADAKLTIVGTAATDTITFTVVEAQIDHDALTNFVADEHVAHSGVTLTAGTGLTGGGDISVNRTFNVDVGIADDKILQVDDADVADNDYAKFTANGLEGRSYAEVLADLSEQATATFNFNNQDVTAKDFYPGNQAVRYLHDTGSAIEIVAGAEQLRVVSSGAGCGIYLYTSDDDDGPTIYSHHATSAPAAAQTAGMWRASGRDDEANQTDWGYIKFVTADVDHSAGTEASQLEFYTRYASATAERMRLAEAGNLYVASKIFPGPTAGGIQAVRYLYDTGSLIGFSVGLSVTGNITVTGDLTVDGKTIIGGATEPIRLGERGDNWLVIGPDDTPANWLDFYLGARHILHYGTGYTLLHTLADNGDFTAAGDLSLGTNPATGGVIRLPNNQAIQQRNAANNADIVMIYHDGSDNLQLGHPGVTTIIHNRADTVIDGGYYLSLSAPTELTISSGVITVTGSCHRIDTEGDAATDDLTTISGGVGGQLLILRAENIGRTVVVKDGVGNLCLAGDCSLDSDQDTIMLIYDATIGGWLELSRSNNL